MNDGAGTAGRFEQYGVGMGLYVYGDPSSTRPDGLVRISDANTASGVPLSVYGHDGSHISAYFEHNVSAVGFIDRTPFPLDDYDALADVRKIKGVGGNVDHKTLPSFVKTVIDVPEYELRMVDVEKQDCTEEEITVCKNITLENGTLSELCEPQTKNTCINYIESELHDVQIGTKQEEGRSLGAMISVNTIALQQLIDRTATLEAELCKKDSSYSFCNKKLVDSITDIKLVK